MKKIYILFTLFAIAFNLAAQNNIIKISPFGFAYGRYNLQYERMLTDYSSASISTSILKPNIPSRVMDIATSFLAPSIDYELNLGGVSMEFDYRLYSQNKKGPRGFYIGPYLRYTNVQFIRDMEANNTKLKSGVALNRIGLGLKLGAQWVVAKNFTIDWNFCGLGSDYYHLVVYDITAIIVNDKGEIDQVKDITQVFVPTMLTNVAISYAF